MPELRNVNILRWHRSDATGLISGPPKSISGRASYRDSAVQIIALYKSQTCPIHATEHVTVRLSAI
jgi:hypothetical protein